MPARPRSAPSDAVRSSRHWLVVDRFYPEGAPALRAVFDERFAEPRSTRGDRFVWDWWHVPDQYTHLRTPAWEYFPPKVYRAFHRALVLWGRRTLGCWDVSPPWLSCYVEGCQQHLHSDVPHGPWAFVYALTPPGPPRFKGGETMIMRPGTLDYWRTFRDAQDRELSSFVERIPSRFDRLIVFDPRLPHGVTRVSGTHDPREGRLVVHGWFTRPRPFFEGARTARQVEGPLGDAVIEVARAFGEGGPVGTFHGGFSVRLDVPSSGQDVRARLLASTLVNTDAPGDGEAAGVRLALRVLRKARFPRASGATRITLPNLFC